MLPLFFKLYARGQTRRRGLCRDGTAAPISVCAKSVTGAADLKFLHNLLRTRLGNFKSKSGTRTIDLLMPFGFRNSCQGCREDHEFRKPCISACKMRYGVNGISHSGIAPSGRSASLMAFITEPGAPAVPASPAPLAPNSESAVGETMCPTSISGISQAMGTR